jgi:Phenazine biosynthesis-like protein
MKYTFHIVDVFSSTPFGGNQLAVLPDASSISTEGMQKIAREFNFGETTFVLPKKDPANTCRVRIFTPRAELDFAGAPSVGTACALVMKQHVRLSDPVQLILEENVGRVTVDVAQRNGGFHGTLTLSGKIEAPTGAPSLTELAAVLSVEPAEVNQVFFRGRRCSNLFCATELERGRRSGGDQSGCLGGNARARGLPTSFSSRENYGMAASSMLVCGHPRLASTLAGLRQSRSNPKGVEKRPKAVVDLRQPLVQKASFLSVHKPLILLD